MGRSVGGRSELRPLARWRANGHPGNGRSLSTMLRELAEDDRRERVSMGDLLDTFRERAFGALIFIFAAPNAIPIPLPGLSALLGAPLVLLTAQLLLGRPKPWLPAFIRTRSFARSEFATVIGRIVPWLERAERLVRPRLLVLTEPLGERLIGLAALLLALVLFSPVPFGNMLPGLALALFGIGLIERDGFAVVAGSIAGLAGFAVVSGAIYGLVAAALFMLRSAFGL
jgi:hypothetical protein